MDLKKFLKERNKVFSKKHKSSKMKSFKAIIERNEDAFFAYAVDIDGCVAGGLNYSEVKANLEESIRLFAEEDMNLAKQISNGFTIKFEIDLESVFDLLPEINISQLAKTGNLNPALLRQYVSGTKKASEKQTEKVMNAIKSLSSKLNSISLSS